MPVRVIAMLALGVMLLLLGCMILGPKTDTSSPLVIAPLHEGMNQPDALSSPEVQRLRGALQARGYHLLPEGIAQRDFLGAQFTFIPFAKGEPISSPEVPLDSASVAYIVHWQGKALALFPPEGNKFRVLYSTGEERTYLSTTGDMLEQLRKNERFVAFERWLLAGHPLRLRASSPFQLLADGAVIDESLGVAYISLELREVGQRSWTASVGAEVKPLREYLVLAKVRQVVQGQGPLIDPASIWLLPRGNGEAEDPWVSGIKAEELYVEGNVAVLVPFQLHRVHAFGEAPVEFGNLRDFGCVSPRSGWDNSLTGPVPQPTAAQAVLRGEYVGVDLFVWGLADWRSENLVLRFKPHSELTLAAYNAAAKHADYGVVGWAMNNQVLNFAGFQSLSPQDLPFYEKKVEEILRNRDKLVLDGVLLWELLADSIGLSAEEVHGLLSTLAEGVDRGDFERVYEELLPQGLERLQRYVLQSDPIYEYLPQEVRERISIRLRQHFRRLALEYREIRSRVPSLGLAPATGIAVITPLKPFLWKLIKKVVILYLVEIWAPDQETEILRQLEKAVQILYATGKVVLNTYEKVTHLLLSDEYRRFMHTFKLYEERNRNRGALELERYLAEIKADYTSIAITSGVPWARLFAPVFGLVYGYYELYKHLQNDNAFYDRARQMSRVLQLLSRSPLEDRWLLAGFIGNPDPKVGVDLLLYRTRVSYTRTEQLRRTELAVVRYEHEQSGAVDVEKIARWINEGVEVVQKWAVQEIFNSVRTGDKAKVSAQVVAVVLEGGMTMTTATDIAREVRLYDDEVVLIVWKEERGSEVVTKIVAVQGRDKGLPVEAIREIAWRITPWEEDQIEVMTQYPRLAPRIVLISGCVWTFVRDGPDPNDPTRPRPYADELGHRVDQ